MHRSPPSSQHTNGHQQYDSTMLTMAAAPSSSSSSSCSVSSSPVSSSSSFFAHPRDATSLQDLAIVRKIVEREGCLEALTQLLTTHARATQSQQARKSSSASMLAASATLASAPMVVTSLLDQLRSVSVQIVESITQWKHQQHTVQSGYAPVFQWRQLNYLAKMRCDLDFLALHGATIAQLPAFRGLRLQRNPFLTPLHLDHAALREETPDMACRLALFVGNVDMRRVFSASQELLREEQQIQNQNGNLHESSTNADIDEDDDGREMMTTITTTQRLHWSHRPMKLSVSMSSPSLRASGVMVTSETTTHKSAEEALAFDVQLAKELVFQHEHELGAMKEELTVLQRKLTSDQAIAAPPDKRRALQTKIAALNHEVKLRTGDLFHRRNELHRKEAVLRTDRRRRGKATDFARALKQQQQQQPLRGDGEDQDPADELSAPEGDQLAQVPPHFSATDTFRHALQADELRRQDLIEKLTNHNKLQASLSLTKRRLQSLSPSPGAQSPSFRSVAGRPSSSGRGRSFSVEATTSSGGVGAMDCDQVQSFVNSVGLGDDAPRYAALFKAHGIDGKSLAQAHDRDLEELGITIRLHRLKILHAVQQATQTL